MKPVLRAPGSKRLQLKDDGLLSSFAFNFNLCHYAAARAEAGEAACLLAERKASDAGAAAEAATEDSSMAQAMVGRCCLTLSKPVLKAPVVSALEATI